MPNDISPPTYEQLTDIDTLRRAWQKVATKRKAGGIDRQTVEGFADTAERDIERLQAELISRHYVPEPYMEVKIPKKDNEMRSLGLLTVRDKVVQQALTDLLTPFIEPRFMDSSYAYRTGRGTQQAVRRVRHCIEHFENRWLVLCDIDRFFDNIPHDLLEKQVRFFIKDENIVQLIFLCVGMGKVSKAGANWQDAAGKGIPQGGVLSPLLANLYLHQLDFFIHQMRKPMGYVRFADDFVLMTREKNQAEAVGKRINDFLTQRLGLALDEFEIKPISEGFSFLGLRFDVESVGLADSKRHEMLEKVNELLYFLPEGGLNPAFKETVEGYQRYIRLLVTDETDFQNREHQGARDLTNMLLNYGYGILYGRLWSAVLNARLHPSVSFLHAPQPKKPTLVFDMVEEFRAAVVDRTVVSLINRKEKLTIEKDGKLSMETRKRLAEKILERINTIENFRGQRIRMGDIMRVQSVNLAKFLLGEAKSYKPYLMKW